MPRKPSAEKTVRDIRRVTRFSQDARTTLNWERSR